MLSFGEAYTAMKKTLRMEKGKFKTDKLEEHLPRMSREHATLYYNEKYKTVFANLGMEKKIIKSDYEIRLPIVFEKIRKNTNTMLVREARKINREYFREVA